VSNFRVDRIAHVPEILDQAIIPEPDDFDLDESPSSILEAYGDSMINAGIDHGDLVLVRQQPTADYNQIVAALIDDEATLKRFRPQLDGTIRLHPENERLDDIIVEAGRCVIQGVVAKILKDVR